MKLRVLIIEDNEDDFLLTRNSLRRAQRSQFEVHWAQSLAEGMERLKVGDIDVVLQDLALPDCRGIETFERLSAAFSQVAIVVLSGNEDEELALQIVRRGAQDYLMKGTLDPDSLGRVVHYAYERKRALVQMIALSEELAERNAILKDELELAHEIQRALHAGAHEKPPGGDDDDAVSWRLSHRYLPTETLAGDFFKVYHLNGGRVGILICDVMGHGVRSALIAALLSGLIEEYACEHQESPAWMLSRLNAGLQRVLKRCHRVDMFATACYIVADPAAGKLSMGSAGHPLPYLKRAAGGEVERLEDCLGPALGLFDDAQFPECTLPIGDGDFVLLYTDGITEVDTPDGGYFESRIAELLAQSSGTGDAILDGLIHEARQYCPGGRFADDVCLVGLAFTQSGAAVAGGASIGMGVRE